MMDMFVWTALSGAQVAVASRALPWVKNWLRGRRLPSVALDATRIHHIFSDPGKNLAGLSAKFGGDETAAFIAVEKAVRSAVTRSGQFVEEVVVRGELVTVRGKVVNGVPRIGTFFVVK